MLKRLVRRTFQSVDFGNLHFQNASICEIRFPKTVWAVPRLNILVVNTGSRGPDLEDFLNLQKCLKHIGMSPSMNAPC